VPTEPLNAAHAERAFHEAQARVRAGDAAGALRALDAAAGAGHAPALLQRGIWRLIGLAGPVDLPAALADVQAAAERAHAPALTLQAQLVAAGAAGQARDFAAVRERLLQAAQAGEPRAAVQLAVLIPATPAHAALRAALLRAAAATGEPVARALFERLPPAPPGPPLAWPALRGAVQEAVAWPHERPLPPAELRHAQPRIQALPGLLSADECLYVVLKGLPLLRPARVVGVDGRAAVDPMRSNDTAKFGLLEADAVLQSLDLRVCAALGQPASHGEGLALLRYQPGQQYLPHCDWIDPAREATQADLLRWGQRIATAVVYLNDGFEGGHTAFPELGLAFRGNVGDAFTWDNVRPDGTVEPRSLHAGRPPLSGVKFLLSKWMRDRDQAFHDT